MTSDPADGAESERVSNALRLTRAEIRNFRSIRHLVHDLGETTVFIGPNNGGNRQSSTQCALR